jgi:PAS domain-containing protein
VLLLPSNGMPRFDGLLHAAIQSDFPQHENAERLRKDGSPIFLAVSRSPIRNEQGDIVAILENTKLLCATQTHSEAQLKRILEQRPMVLWTTDANLGVTFCLGAGFRSAKNQGNEIIGKSVCEYLKRQDPHTTPTAQHYQALRGMASQFEYKRNGRVLELHLEPNSGEIVGCIGAGMDITARKRSEA